MCGAANPPLAVACAECRAFLQARVDALDLFRTVWGLAESPRAALRRIALAREKNHAALLSTLAGIAISSWFMRLRAAGDAGGVLQGLAAGAAGGIVGTYLLALLLKGGAALLGGKGTVRDLRAVAAYAMAPVVATLFLVFPAHLAVFGLDLFRDNPPPMAINPAAYVILTGIEILAAGWSWALLAGGASVAGGLTGRRAAVMTAATAFVTAGALVLLR